MPTAAASGPIVQSKPGAWPGQLLFMAVFLFFWITLDPFLDLTGAGILDPSAGNSSLLNQIAAVLLFCCMLAYGLKHPLRGTILQPRALMLILFGWFLLVSLISGHPMLGIKGTVLAIMVAINASIYLLLPQSERHFGQMLGWGTLMMLGVAYGGLILSPQLSIHQASELREPMNAGLWRGHFPHKNSAAAAMVIAAFFGLFVMRAWSWLAGALIVALCFLFLINTGGKSSMAMLPAIIGVAWIFEKFRFLRAPIVLGGCGLLNLFSVGSAVFRPLGDVVASLGIDATFTNRSDIWRFAFSALAERPVTGYGFRGFWQTSDLVYSGGTVETWAVTAANGHNSYLDIALMTGIPGLVLTLIWLLLQPLRSIARLPPERERSPLTRLYIRVWLYAVFSGGLESFFFEGGNLVWFTLLFSLNGLHLQSAAALTARTPHPARKAEAHA
jgi:O-antigen ligase